MAQRTQKIKRLRPRTELSPEENIIGTHDDGRPIIERTFTRENRVPILDKDGEQAWKFNQLGQPITPLFKLVPEEVTEVYVYDELPTGHNFKNRHFRPDPEQVAAQAQRDAAAKLQEDFFSAAAARGLTADQIADFVADGARSDVPVEEKTAAADVIEREVQRRLTLELERHARESNQIQDVSDATAPEDEPKEPTEDEVNAAQKRAAEAQQEIKDRKARAARRRRQKAKELREKQAAMAEADKEPVGV